jgi:hypothetical protein
VKLWSATTGHNVLTLNDIDAAFVAFSPDGKHFITPSRKEMKMWEIVR